MKCEQCYTALYGGEQGGCLCPTGNRLLDRLVDENEDCIRKKVDTTDARDEAARKYLIHTGGRIALEVD